MPENRTSFDLQFKRLVEGLKDRRRNKATHVRTCLYRVRGYVCICMMHHDAHKCDLGVLSALNPT